MKQEKKRTVNKEIEKVYELTPMQEGMLFHNIINKDSTSYILQVRMDIKNSFNEEFSRNALKVLCYRFEVLRSIFTARTTNPLQIVRRTIDFEYNVEHFESDILDEDVLSELTKKDLEKGFNLEKELPIRITQANFIDSSSIIWSIHHIVVDGWSLSSLLMQFMHYYKLFTDGNSYEDVLNIADKEKLEDLSYVNYVQWLKKKNTVDDKGFWSTLLAGYEEKQVVPFCSSNLGEEKVTSISILGENYKKIKNLACEAQVTMSTLIETAYGILLQRLTGSDDVVIGKVVSGRDCPLNGINHAVGLFVNTIPSRICCLNEDRVYDLLKKQQEQSNELTAHENSSLVSIQKECMNGAQITGLYAFENYYINPQALAEMEAYGINVSYTREETNYPLTLQAFENDKITLSLMFDNKLFSLDDCDRMLSQLKCILEQMCEEEAKIGDITGIGSQEKSIIRDDFNNTFSDYARDSSVVDLFEEQVGLRQDEIALL